MAVVNPFSSPGSRDVDLTFSNFILLIQGSILGNLTAYAFIPNAKGLTRVGIYIVVLFIL